MNKPFPSVCASVSERVLEQNLSYENEFDLHENEPVDGTYFRMNGKRHFGNEWFFRCSLNLPMLVFIIKR